jgi:hypothetical protein
MDFYRKRFGPEDGYEHPGSQPPPRDGMRSTQSSPGGAHPQQYLVDYRTPGAHVNRCGAWGRGLAGRKGSEDPGVQSGICAPQPIWPTQDNGYAAGWSGIFFAPLL